jgi:hypothetical protein
MIHSDRFVHLHGIAVGRERVVPDLLRYDNPTSPAGKCKSGAFWIQTAFRFMELASMLFKDCSDADHTC